MKWKRKIVWVPGLAGACLLGVWFTFGGTGLPEEVDRPPMPSVTGTRS